MRRRRGLQVVKFVELETRGGIEVVREGKEGKKGRDKTESRRSEVRIFA